jgi:hypothetical protein
MRIEELQQQWESAESPGELSQQLLWKLRQQLSDGLAPERSISHSARMVIAIAKYPRLADRATRQRCGEKVAQTPAAPKPILINRFELQGIQEHLTQGMSLSLSPIAGGSLSPCLAWRRKSLTAMAQCSQVNSTALSDLLRCAGHCDTTMACGAGYTATNRPLPTSTPVTTSVTPDRKHR